MCCKDLPELEQLVLPLTTERESAINIYAKEKKRNICVDVCGTMQEKKIISNKRLRFF